MSFYLSDVGGSPLIDCEEARGGRGGGEGLKKLAEHKLTFSHVENVYLGHIGLLGMGKGGGGSHGKGGGGWRLLLYRLRLYATVIDMDSPGRQ